MTDKVERRSEPRTRAFKRGMVVFNNRYSSAECTIKNESANGAKLQVGQNQTIPNTVEIRHYPDPAYHPARVVWRTEEAIGIEFDQPQPKGRAEWDGTERRGQSGQSGRRETDGKVI